MRRWAVLDLTDAGAPPIHIGRSRLYARFIAAWLGQAAIIPWERS